MTISTLFLTDRQTDRQKNRQTGGLSDQPTSWLTDWLHSWLAGWLTSDKVDVKHGPTRRKTLLSGFTLCFSMYLIRLLFAYLVKKTKTLINNKQIESVNISQTVTVATHVVLLKSFCSVGYSGIFLMSSQSLSARRTHSHYNTEMQQHLYIKGPSAGDHLQGSPWRWKCGPAGRGGRGC